MINSYFYRTFVTSSFLFFTLSLYLFGSSKELEFFNSDYLNNSRVTLRHTEPKGLGYDQGYTTLSGEFFAPSLNQNTIWPFFDLRAHCFDDGQWASNAGVGIRYMPNSRLPIFGVNSFIDYRMGGSKRFHYFQVGVGLELLGEYWNFRLNSYLPIHSKKTIGKYFFDYPGGWFIKHREYLSAMSGVSGEVGRYFGCWNSANQIYIGVGPYYYVGRFWDTREEVSKKRRVGGRLRGLLKLRDAFILQGTFYYDSSSHFIAQCLIGVYFYLGSTRQRCSRARITSQSVYRNEVIVLEECYDWEYNF